MECLALAQRNLFGHGHRRQLRKHYRARIDVELNTAVGEGFRCLQRAIACMNMNTAALIGQKFNHRFVLGVAPTRCTFTALCPVPYSMFFSAALSVAPPSTKRTPALSVKAI